MIDTTNLLYIFFKTCPVSVLIIFILAACFCVCFYIYAKLILHPSYPDEKYHCWSCNKGYYHYYETETKQDNIFGSIQTVHHNKYRCSNYEKEPPPTWREPKQIK